MGVIMYSAVICYRVIFYYYIFFIPFYLRHIYEVSISNCLRYIRLYAEYAV